LTLTNSGSGTLLAGTATNGSVTSYLDTNNALATGPSGPSGPGVSTTAAVLFGLPNNGDLSFSGTTSLNGISANGAYSLTNLDSFTLNSGGIMNFTGDEGLVTPGAVPAPASLVLILTGAPIGGVWFWRRRKAGLTSAPQTQAAA
jgi:hypothetical protein